MNTRRIGPFEVSSVSLGCMNLSHAYGAPPTPEAAEKLLLRALELGVTMFDTAALYGFGANETLVGRVLKAHRSKITLASKGGMAGVAFDDGIKRVIDGSPEAIVRNCEDSLKRLGTEVIDLYYLHRWDKRVPIEDSVGAMARLVREGKVRALGLSEVSAATLRRAHAVHPIVAVQSEYSLWSRNVEIGVLQACSDIGASLVAFSPTARAFLTGALRDVSALDAKDIRRGMPRFYPENYAQNLKLLDGYAAIAQHAGCSMAQLAIAWVLSRGEHVIALPGTTSLAHLEEDLAADTVSLSPDTLQRLDALINRHTVVGARYNPATQAEVDTEEYAA
ncbi:MAG: aldo/keto reductase [Burkholderiaceae bacterium]|nr:aldo/keto reductase [Burkholderiaceae bacterium]